MAVSNLGKELARASCSDFSSGDHRCDLSRGYFAFFEESEWDAAKFDLRDWSPMVKPMSIPSWCFVIVPANGWPKEMGMRLPFIGLRGRLICPRHMVERLRAAPRPKNTLERRLFVGGLARGVGSKRAALLLRLLHSRRVQREHVLSAIKLVEAALDERSSLQRSMLDEDLEQLSLIRGTPAELERLAFLVGEARFPTVTAAERLTMLDDVLKYGLLLLDHKGQTASLNLKQLSSLWNKATAKSPAVAHPKRLIRMDEALEFAFELLVQSGETKASCYRIIGQGFHPIFHTIVDKSGMDRELNSPDHGLSIKRFTERIKQRLLRREIARKRAAEAAVKTRRQWKGKSFKKKNPPARRSRPSRKSHHE